MDDFEDNTITDLTAQASVPKKALFRQVFGKPTKQPQTLNFTEQMY